MRNRWRLLIGLLVCLPMLALWAMVAITSEPKSAWDPKELRTIKVGMTIDEVEEILGIAIWATVKHGTNKDSSITIPTTREHSVAPEVNIECFTIWFDEAGKVRKTGGAVSSRQENVLDKLRRWFRL